MLKKYRVRPEVIAFPTHISIRGRKEREAVTPEQARDLAQALLDAADLVDGDGVPLPSDGVGVVVEGLRCGVCGNTVHGHGEESTVAVHGDRVTVTLSSADGGTVTVDPAHGDDDDV